MKINIKTTNISMTPAISAYVEKKVSMLEKFFAGENEILANVEVGKTTRHHKSGDVFRAEVHLMAGGEEQYAVSETDDLYAAIDEVKDELSYKLSSKKKKNIHLVRRGGAVIKNLLKGIGEFGTRGWKKFRKGME